MTTQATLKKGKKTSSTSKPRRKTAPSMNCSASTTNAFNGSDSDKPKCSETNGKTSLPGVSTSSKKNANGKFAFKGPKTSRPSSQPSGSGELTAAERLFSLADLKELAAIVKEQTPAGAALKEGTSRSIARSTQGSRQSSKKISKQTPKKKGAVRFQKKNGDAVEFHGRKKEADTHVAPVPVVQDDEEDMPPLNGYQNPYSYAFT